MIAPHDLVPVLEVGGTHVTAALVSIADAVPVVLEHHRLPLPSEGSAAEIVEQLAAAASRIDGDNSRLWGIAVPGPFDYEDGIGRFEEVGKFESLNGFNLGAALVSVIRPVPLRIRFLNDADAFGLGEYAAGAARDYRRVICLTLGTGVGSAFVADGVPVNDGPRVPPDGSAHLLTWDGRALEETVSRRALRARYRVLTGEDLDIHEIANKARSGDDVATRVLDEALKALGCAIAPWIESFSAEILVVGGSIAKSWDLVERPLRAGIAATRPELARISLAPAALPEEAPLIGAAEFAR